MFIGIYLFQQCHVVNSEKLQNQLKKNILVKFKFVWEHTNITYIYFGQIHKNT